MQSALNSAAAGIVFMCGRACMHAWQWFHSRPAHAVMAQLPAHGYACTVQFVALLQLQLVASWCGCGCMQLESITIPQGPRLGNTVVVADGLCKVGRVMARHGMAWACACGAPCTMHMCCWQPAGVCQRSAWKAAFLKLLSCS